MSFPEDPNTQEHKPFKKKRTKIKKGERGTNELLKLPKKKRGSKETHRRFRKPLPKPHRKSVKYPPPFVIGIIGPSNSGQLSIFNGILKIFGIRHQLKKYEGPFTFVSENQKRFTLVMNSDDDFLNFVDYSKICNLILLTIDIFKGFTLLHFEFLNLLKQHGFVQIWGMLTTPSFSLDRVMPNRFDEMQVKKKIRGLRKRLQKEVLPNSRIFQLTDPPNAKRIGHSKYGVTDEFFRLKRYLGPIKPKPIPYRHHHPYVIIDDYYFSEEDSKHYFSGFVRGNFWNKNVRPLSIIGMGNNFNNFRLISKRDPFFSSDSDQQSDLSHGNDEMMMLSIGNKKKRKKKNIKFYSPLNLRDKFVFISPTEDEDDEEEEDSQEKKAKEIVVLEEEDEDDEDDLFSNIFSEKTKETEEPEIELIKGKKIAKKKIEEDVLIPPPPILPPPPLPNQPQQQPLDTFSNIITNNFSFGGGVNQDVDYNKLVYEDRNRNLNQKDLTIFKVDTFTKNWDVSENVQSLKSKCITGTDLLEEQPDEEEQEKDDYQNDWSDDNEEEEEEKDEDEDDDEEEEEEEVQEKEKKEEEVYNENVEGVSPGTYLLFQFNHFPTPGSTSLRASPHFNFRASPLVFFLPFEEAHATTNFSCLKIKKHRYFEKEVLKSEDPFILSIGFQRFQSVCTFFLGDRNMKRNRYLKYTPKHTFCEAVCVGNKFRQNTPVIGIYNLYSGQKREESNLFRICFTGFTTHNIDANMDNSFEIQKKLKLIGTPSLTSSRGGGGGGKRKRDESRQKNNIQIKKMFSSKIEVVKFMGARLNSVSGIRGIVKKPIGTNGDFRANFEAPILNSEIVFLKTFVKKKIKRFYNPIYNHLNRNFVLLRNSFQLKLIEREKKEEKPQEEDVEEEDKEEEEEEEKEKDVLVRAENRNMKYHGNQFKMTKKINLNLPFENQSKVVLNTSILEEEEEEEEDGSISVVPTDNKLVQDVILSEEEKRRINFLKKLKGLESNFQKESNKVFFKAKKRKLEDTLFKKKSVPAKKRRRRKLNTKRKNKSHAK